MNQKAFGKLKYLMNKGRNIRDICLVLDIELEELYDMVAQLNIMGFGYDIVDGVSVKTNNCNLELFESDCIHRTEEYCFFSDPHCGSIYDRIDLLELITRECEIRGISKIFCSGDITDGFYPNRQNHPSELRVIGPEATVDYFANNYPEINGLTTYIILGNHDKTFIRNYGVDIGEEISKIRNDFVYVKGEVVDLNFGDLKIRMLHGDGINAHNLRNEPKQYIRTLPNDVVPDIIQLGHTHRSYYKRQDSTHILQTASLMDETPRARAMQKYGERSCWFVKVGYDVHGNVVSIVPELERLGKSRVRIKNYV